MKSQIRQAGGMGTQKYIGISKYYMFIYFFITTEMNAAVDILLQSPGFGMSNAPDTVQWVNGQFPADLQPFADVIKRSQSFVSKV